MRISATLTSCISETRVVEQHRAAGIAAEKFDGAALDAVEHEVGADHLPGEALARAQPDQKEKIQEFGGGFVELRRMELNAQRRARDSRGDWIRERDAPGKRRRLAVAAAGREAAEAADRMAQRQRGGEGVEHGSSGIFWK